MSSSACIEVAENVPRELKLGLGNGICLGRGRWVLFLNGILGLGEGRGGHAGLDIG